MSLSKGLSPSPHRGGGLFCIFPVVEQAKRVETSFLIVEQAKRVETSFLVVEQA